jgi:hypothetical protein
MFKREHSHNQYVPIVQDFRTLILGGFCLEFHTRLPYAKGVATCSTVSARCSLLTNVGGNKKVHLAYAIYKLST